MIRKSAWSGFSFLAALMLAAVLRSNYNLILLPGAVALFIAAFSFLKTYRKEAVVCLVFFMLGLLTNTVYTKNVYEKLVAFDGETVTIEGYIKDHSQATADFERVVVRGKVGGVKTDISFMLPVDDYKYYQSVTVTGEVSRIRDSLKFEGEKYYYSQGVFLQGGFNAEYKLGDKCHNYLMRFIKNYRDRLFVLINEDLHGDVGAFLSAMLCGDKSEMSPALKTTMYRSGLGHIFAVSGTHLVICGFLFGLVVKKLIPIRKADYILTLCVIWGFAMFAGLSVSVVRSAIMLTLAESGFIFGRRSDGLNSLGLCAMVLSVSNPYSVISASFVLSFSAVLGLCVMAPKIELEAEGPRAANYIKYYAKNALCVLFFTAPASAVLFKGVSVAAVVSNILLVPLCVIGLTLCFAVFFTGGVYFIAGPLLLLASLPVKLVLFFAKLLARLRFCYVYTSSAAMVLIITLSALALIVYVMLFSSKRFATASALVMLFWFLSMNVSVLTSPEMTLTILPDGRNKTEYIITSHGKATLFDVNCRGSMDSAVQRFIDNRGVSSLEMAFISSKGPSVASNYDETFCELPSRIFISSEPLTQLKKDTKKRIAVLSEGKTADVGSMQVSFNGSGYTLIYGELTLYLGQGLLKVNDNVYTFEDNYPYEFDFTQLTLRRLDHGFN